MGHNPNAPIEMFMHIYSFTSFKEMASLASTCKAAFNAMCKMPHLKFGEIRLTTAQAHIRDRALKMVRGPPGVQNRFVVRAPMGFGKTPTGLSVALMDPGNNRYAIIVPSKAYTTWKAEAIRITKQSTAVNNETVVLFVDSSVEAHYNLVVHSDIVQEIGDSSSDSDPETDDDYDENKGLNKRARRYIDSIKRRAPNVRAILVSARSQAGIRCARMWANRLIVDEAHAATKSTWMSLRSFRWAALLSANTVRPRKDTDAYAVTVDKVYISSSMMLGAVPKAEVNYVTIKACPPDPSFVNEMIDYAGPADKTHIVANNIASYEAALIKIFASIRNGQVAVFVPDGAPGDAISLCLDKNLPGWKCITFTRATSKLALFAKAPRSVLLINLNKSEALNIVASHLIVVRPDWVNIDRYAQTIGRVLRPTNANLQIPTFLVMPRGVPALRVMYFEANRRLQMEDLDFKPVDFRASELRKAKVALQLCGSDMERAAPAEIFAAIGYGIEYPAHADDLLDNWLADTNQTIPLGLMVKLLDLAPALAPAPAPDQCSDAAAEINDADLDELLGWD